MAETHHHHHHLCDYLDPPRRHPDAPLFTSRSQTITATQALHHVSSIANTFINDLSLRPGDRVATLADCTPQHLETLLAVTAAGGIAAPLNWRWSPLEIVHALRLIQASVLCVERSHLDLAMKSIALVHNTASTTSESQSTTAATLLKIKALVVLDPEPDGTTKSILEGTSEDVDTCFYSYADIITMKGTETTRLCSPWRHNEDNAAFLIFTSGTTGPPRAALLSHKAVDFQCKCKEICCNYSVDDVYLHAAQFFHVGGLCSALAMLRVGAQHVFALPLFRASDCLRAIEEYKVTSFIAVPTMISDLVSSTRNPASSSSFFSSGSLYYYSSLRGILIGAGGLTPSMKKALQAMFPKATVYCAYGMTEACSSITFFETRSTMEQADTNGTDDVFIGSPPPGIELAILTQQDQPGDRCDGTAVVQHHIMRYGSGEILTRGPHVMLRYWNDPAATAASFIHSKGFDGNDDPSGTVVNTEMCWFRTGDLGIIAPGGSGVRDSGSGDQRTTSGASQSPQHVQIVSLIGRVKDVVKSGGENVPAAEVERVLLRHPAIAAAAVVGIPDARLGEKVSAAIVLHPPWKLLDTRIHNAHKTTDSYITIDALQRHCRNCGLAGFKLPRAFVTFGNEENNQENNAQGDILPRNATGKVLKSKLRDIMIDRVSKNKQPGGETGLGDTPHPSPSGSSAPGVLRVVSKL